MTMRQSVKRLLLALLPAKKLDMQRGLGLDRIRRQRTSKERWLDETGDVLRVEEEVSLVATTVSYCTTHQATDHDDGRAWSGCRFRQLFYFENPMDEHTLMWSDGIAGDAYDNYVEESYVDGR